MKRRTLLLAALPLPALATQPTLAELLRRGDDDGAVRAMCRALEYRAEYRRWPRLVDEVMRSGWGNCTDMAWVFEVNGLDQHMHGALDHVKGPADLLPEAWRERDAKRQRVREIIASMRPGAVTLVEGGAP